MVMYEGILLSLVCLLFPLSIYIICTAYIKNLDLKTKRIFLELALYSSIYLLIKFGNKDIFIYPMILLNVPLLIAYLKKKIPTAVIISIVLIIFYNVHLNIDIVYLVLEYIIYYLVFAFTTNKLTSNRIITTFVFIKSFIISFEVFFFINPHDSTINNLFLILTTMFVFTAVSYLILYFLKKGEETIDLNNIVHELEKEKTLRESLFKITHEIKNPIAVCKGYLDMMDYNDIKKVKRYNSIIKDEIDRTLILMDDFLDYTKIKIDRDEVDLYMLLEDTCSAVKPLFRKNNINLKLDIPDDEVYMMLDYNRLKQVLVNILKNSIEAKDIKKKDSYVSINVKEEKSDIELIIKDNGIGMDKKTLDRVCDMFYTTKEKGTGLGVALSKEIIEQHGGSIKYHSVKDKSTTVIIKLPIDEALN